ncbi:fimbrial protein [Stenotrophomonas sp. WHRI 8082]|uniref:fimbrial protein n=1 Tax=Stenotrophomonas sp. WHRI 8082 TaxID=3162571 RepID=UPI0032EF9F6B
MKHSAIRIPLALFAIALASASHAQSGEITFNGQVTSVTCEVSFNGVVGDNPTIILPTVAASSLRMGESGGLTPVVMHVNGADPQCSSGTVSVVLNATRAANLRNGRLINTGPGIGGGTNVAVALRDRQDQPIDLTGGVILTGTPAVGGGVDIHFSSEYYADVNDGMPGIFRAPLGYTLTYR